MILSDVIGRVRGRLAAAGRERLRGAIVDKRRSLALAMVVASIACLPMPAAAQGTNWDAILSNSYWYVPVPNLIAYTSGNRNLTINPLPIGDQTLWSIGPASNGAFIGESQATFATGSTVDSPTYAFMQGVVTDSGQIRITFTSPTGNPQVIGIGQMEIIDGVPLMEMQMITGT